MKKVMNKSLFDYIIHVKDSPSPCVNDNSMHDNVSTQFNVHDDDDDAHCLHLNELWHTYDSRIVNRITSKLPPIRGDDDHRIELIQISFPPNKAPYRVSMAQQEEIMAQVNELLDKGMIHPNSSPYCSLVLLV